MLYFAIILDIGKFYEYIYFMIAKNIFNGLKKELSF
jgi:hypothetical protein